MEFVLNSPDEPCNMDPKTERSIFVEWENSGYLTPKPISSHENTPI